MTVVCRIPGTGGGDLDWILSRPEYGVEYQPLVSLADGTVAGFEALTRFRDPFGRPLPPDRVFEALHAFPADLFTVEYRAKQCQIAHAPAGVPLYLNIDPDAFLAGGDGPDNPLLALVGDGVGRVVEITENLSLSDARISLAMLARFRDRRVRLALDDLGARDTLTSFEVLARVDDVKLARDWLDRRDDLAQMALLRALCGFARAAGKRTIFEGIETPDDLDWARAMGADLAQGFLFRPDFLAWRPSV